MVADNLEAAHRTQVTAAPNVVKDHTPLTKSIDNRQIVRDKNV